MRGRIGDTIWVVQEDGSLRATFGAGDDATHARLVGTALGTHDPIRLTVQRGAEMIHASEHGDMVSALDAVDAVILAAQAIAPRAT